MEWACRESIRKKGEGMEGEGRKAYKEQLTLSCSEPSIRARQGRDESALYTPENEEEQYVQMAAK